MIQKTKPRGYKNQASSERVSVSTLSAPFRVSNNGTFQYARHNGIKWVW